MRLKRNANANLSAVSCLCKEKKKKKHINNECRLKQLLISSTQVLIVKYCLNFKEVNNELNPKTKM